MRVAAEHTRGTEMAEGAKKMAYLRIAEMQRLVRCTFTGELCSRTHFILAEILVLAGCHSTGAGGASQY